MRPTARLVGSLSPPDRHLRPLTMREHRPVTCWLTDMDGVLVHEQHAIPGAADFIADLQRHRASVPGVDQQLHLHPRDLRARLLASGIDLPEESIWTSALATAQFLAEQSPGGSMYVIGEAVLTTALHEAGFVMTETIPTTWFSARPGPIRSRRSPRPSGCWRRGASSSPPTPTPPDPRRTGRCPRPVPSQP